MATDIAFALGVLALAASHASPRLKPLLLTLAIVDDIGAIIVIAIFYTGGVDAAALIAAFAIVGLIAIANAVHIRFILLYVLLGAALWYATYQAGIHPTIAGVVLGMLTPAAPFQRPAAVSEQARRTADETSDDPTAVDDDAQWWMRLAWLSVRRSRRSCEPSTRCFLDELRHPPDLRARERGRRTLAHRLAVSLTAPVSVGIFLGLVLGKPVGVLVGSFITVRTGLGRLGGDVGWGDLTGMGMTAGIGFTVALHRRAAFPSGPRLDEAKTAILAASLVAGIAGYLTLRVAPSPGVDPGDTVRATPFSATLSRPARPVSSHAP